MTPEAKARQEIDAQLTACGWVVQDFKTVDFSAGRGIALREVPLKTGPCDYLLLVDRHALGVVEAKKQGTTLSVVAEQSTRYATASNSRSGTAFERGGGVGVGGNRQSATGGPFAAINLAESIHRRIGMKPSFLIHPSSFCLGVPSILQKAFTGELI